MLNSHFKSVTRIYSHFADGLLHNISVGNGPYLELSQCILIFGSQPCFLGAGAVGLPSSASCVTLIDDQATSRLLICLGFHANWIWLIAL
ncbi:hypothetical protein GPALN_002962 [Globodera pallida]|nr:hypothetical protein GPALN_002962 [Globodera pallida]